MRLIVVVTALLFAALPVHADQVSDDADAIAACMGDAWPRDARALCAGAVSAPCQLALGAESTESMNLCLAREADAWNAVMERQFPELMQRAREVDAAGAASAGLESAAEALENAQRAWQLYRDAECRFARASWGDGGFRAVALSACVLDLTARRAVDFQARLLTGG
ncbi:MAG TPA: lysozyme inhibitor LprI family protein [Thermohalobaculum sp.]|nr:lysozyme inhibitor LprI family protein [Thermohalobaculum sp.]